MGEQPPWNPYGRQDPSQWPGQPYQDLPTYPPQQLYGQPHPWNPHDQSDPGWRQGQSPQQDQGYRGQPYQGQPSYPPQQPPYGQDLQDPQPPHTGQQHGPRGQASWPSRHKVLTGVIAVAALFIAGSIGAAAAKGSGSAAPTPAATVTEIQHDPGPTATVTETVAPTANAQGEATQISDDGVYVVGTDIAGGTWHTSGGSQCYEATLASTDTSNIIDNNNFTGPDTVSLAGVKAFDISGGCTWQHEG